MALLAFVLVAQWFHIPYGFKNAYWSLCALLTALELSWCIAFWDHKLEHQQHPSPYCQDWVQPL